MSEQSLPEDVIPHGEAIVERFGGIRPMASKLNVPVTTVQGWKKRDAIPAIRREEILNAAAHYDIDLKGLIAEASNQNARAGGISEDPALLSRPAAPQPQAAPQQQTRSTPYPPQAGAIDMRQIKRTARMTSLVTTTCLVAAVAGVGLLLFGGRVDPSPNGQLQNLEARMNVVEQKTLSPSGGASISGAIGEQVANLQTQVRNLSSVVGAATSDELATLARSVAAGTGASLTSRLAVLEQQLTQGMQSGGATGAAPGTSGLSGMMSKLESLTQNPQGQAELQSAIADLQGLVGNLQGRMDGLDSALVEAKSENDALGRTLSDISARDLGAAAMLLGLTELRQSVDRQEPLADDLALIKQVAGTDPELSESLDRMTPYAESGVLSAAGLKRELQGAANDIITAKLKGEDVSMKDKVTARLEGMFSIKKDGVSVAGGRERELIDRAGKQLDAGDVQGAKATLAQLDGPAAEAAAGWQSKADATLAAQALDGQLVKAIIAKVKGGLATMGGGHAPINLAPVRPQPQNAAPAPTVMPDPDDGMSSDAPSFQPAPPVVIQQ